MYNKIGLNFKITLHKREKEVLKGILNYFNLNNTIYESDKSTSIHINKFSTIENIILPFFIKYPILGVKSLDFEDFKTIFSIMKKKNHLTPEGIERIKALNLNMNNRRV